MKIKKPEINITHDYGAELLRQRGIEDVNLFLNPTINCLQSWKDFDNIYEGLRLVISVLKEPDPKIALVVDCDTDGYTSAAIIHNYIQCLRPVEFKWFIHEGKQHGLSDVIDEIIEAAPFNLLIVPDAASNDYEYIEQLKKYEIPVLILDHHIVEDINHISDNCVLINNQSSTNYRNKYLSGAGVAWQFCRGLDEFYDVSYSNQFIDLAALGVCGDMMSALEYENQYIWHQGFSRINNIFFKTLCEKQAFSMKNVINPTSVAFYIVPLINGMVRSGSYKEKCEMFEAFIDGKKLVPSEKRGAKGTMDMLANEVARKCTNAKAHQDKFKKEITEELDGYIKEHNLLDNKVLFIRLNDDIEIPSTLTGIVAMQLSTKYARPTLIGRLDEDGFISGSARCPEGTELNSLKEFLSGTALFDYTLGHDQAFGFKIANERLAEFIEKSNEELKDVSFDESVFEVSFCRNAADGDIDSIIFDLAKYDFVWGQLNKTPLIGITNIYCKPSDFKVMGKNNDTVKITVGNVSYIKFFAKDIIQKIQSFGSKELAVSIVGESNLNEWMGSVSPQIIIKDIEVENFLAAF